MTTEFIGERAKRVRLYLIMSLEARGIIVLVRVEYGKLFYESRRILRRRRRVQMQLTSEIT